MAPILLIHGAWHGAWCWDRLIPALAARGRQAVAIDLPAAGDDPTPIGQVTLDLYAERVVGALAALGEPAVLVGHSMGGPVDHRGGRARARADRQVGLSVRLSAARWRIPAGSGCRQRSRREPDRDHIL